jgi:hypothetical protein
MARKKKSRIVAFEMVDIRTGAVVHTVPVSKDAPDSYMEKLERALVRKTDTDRFFVREVRNVK